MNKLLIMVLILFFILYLNKKLQYSNIREPLFFSKNETRYYLLNDKDRFIKSLNQINLIARNSKTHKAYIKKSSESSLNFLNKEKEKIKSMYLKSCTKLLNHPNSFLYRYGLDKDKLRQLFNRDIFIALTKDKKYEYGMPHTRENIIFLSSYYLNKNINNEKKLIITLTHEIIHLYQRFYREDYNIFLKNKGWKIINFKKFSRKRINPDLDQNIWERQNKLYISEFTSDIPKSLEDINNKQSNMEHPYEYYAYKISNF